MNGLNTGPATGATEGVFTLPEFVFESGERLKDVKIGYVRHGVLNAARDNAILLMPGTANTRHSVDGYIGTGNALDPARHFIIATDAIGAGTSSQPKDGLGPQFPRYNIRDLVRAQHAFVTDAFGITRLKAVFGASMGAFQALEWAIHFPATIDRAALLVPAARAGQVFKSVVKAMIEVLYLNPAIRNGGAASHDIDALRAAGRLYYPWTVSDAYIQSLPADQLETEIQGTIQRATEWDTWNFIRRYECSAGHDVSTPFGGNLQDALKQVTAPLLVMPSSTDRLLGVQSARDIARHVRQADYVEIPSPRGHLGWRAETGTTETELVVRQVTNFLS